MVRTWSSVLVGLAALPLFAATASASPRCRFEAGAVRIRRPHGAQIPIDTIVVMMQENRSFDHYLGQLHFEGQPHALAEPAGTSNPDPTSPTGPPIVAFHQTRYCEVADLDHSWNGTHREWDGGAMDGFTAANVFTPDDPTGSRTMGFYESTDLPFYYALFSTFAMGDRYFSSALTQTFPNRFYLLAGTSFGHIRNDFPSDDGTINGVPEPTEFSQPTIFELLDNTGVSWKIYFSEEAFALLFAYVRMHPEKQADIQQYFTDAQVGALPQVVFIDPLFNLTGQEPKNTENDEHPPANIQVGEEFASRVVNALIASPQWASSALFFTYDEHGGFFDHVPPPPACTPDSIPPNLQTGDDPGTFDRYGIRVPVVVVSPFARPHYVSHRVYDHTSILRFIETRFDLPALTRRDANADPMLRLFKFRRPRLLNPPALPAAPIDQSHTECQ
jgi:phospholipase C